MNKNLKIKIRDLADDHWELRTKKLNIDEFNKETIAVESFKLGATACHDLMLGDMKKLLEALEEIAIEQDFYIKSKDYFSEVVRLNLTAKQALQEYKSKWGEG